jgi:pimeloyl-ACP methyl ester carboxylesterase
MNAASSPLFDEQHGAAGGEPVVLGQACGMLHKGHRDTAVLICPPWGYEALCAYKSLRILADLLQARGFSVLRFDYPATGDHPTPPEDLSGIDDWRASVVDAAAGLTHLTGAKRVVLLGLGLGTLLARLAAETIGNLAGLALLGPVNDGRRYLRELASWSAMIDDSIGLDRSGKAQGLTAIAGFEMPEAVAQTLKGIGAKSVPLSQVPHLVAQRNGIAGDLEFVEMLQAHAVPVHAIAFSHYEALLSDPTAARTPMETWQAVGDWMSDTFAAASGTQRTVACAPAHQLGDGFREEFLRFGKNRRLFGILCEPQSTVTSGERPLYVLLNSGFDPHTGWARSTVDQARALARAGISTLRIDLADIGDSPAVSGGPAMVLYADSQVDDVIPAIDLAQARGYAQIFLAGRCAGAYVAFNAAVADARVTGAVIVNLQRLVWDPDEDVEEAVRNAFRSLDNYKSRLLQIETFKRMLRGEIDVLRVGTSILRRLAARVGVKLAPYAFGLTKHARLRNTVLQNFDALQRRKVMLSLVYSADDGGLDELATYFGKGGQALSGSSQVAVSIIPDADHNMTPRAARERLIAHLIAFASQPLLRCDQQTDATVSARDAA